MYSQESNESKESKLYIEKYNKFKKCFFEFLDDLKNTFPEYQELIITNYNNNDNFTKNDINNFMSVVNNYLTDISIKNENIFINSDICFLKGINFSKLWQKLDLSESIKETIWKYLHSLYIIGASIYDTELDIKNFIESFDINNENVDEKTSALFNMITNVSSEKKNYGINDNNNETDKKNNSNPIFPGLDLEKSNIAKIANELAQDINLDDLNINNVGDIFSELMGNGNGKGSNLMNLVSKVGDKIKDKISAGNINESDLLSEAQNMMGQIHNGPAKDLFNSFNINPENIAKNMNQYNSNNKTKDRLREKLESKNKEKNNNLELNDPELKQKKKKKKKKKKIKIVENSDNIEEIS